MEEKNEDQNIIQLNEANSLNPNGTVKQGYYKTTSRFPTPPYCHIPFFLDSYNPATKKFTIIILTDKRKLDYIPVGMPCVPITEEQAQEIVNHRLRLKKPSEKPSVVLQGRKEIVTSDQAKPQGRRGRPIQKTSIRQLVLQGYADRKSKEEVVSQLSSFHPEKSKEELEKLFDFYQFDAKRNVKLED